MGEKGNAVPGDTRGVSEVSVSTSAAAALMEQSKAGTPIQRIPVGLEGDPFAAGVAGAGAAGAGAGAAAAAGAAGIQDTPIGLEGDPGSVAAPREQGSGRDAALDPSAPSSRQIREIILDAG